MFASSLLIVDDNKETREVMGVMARKLAFGRVDMAGSVSEALEVMHHKNNVGLVVCDWNMPEQTGLDLLKQLREAGNMVPFIMVTGRNDVDSVLEARKHGVDLYISKPFSQEEFEKKMEWVRRNGSNDKTKKAAAAEADAKDAVAKQA